MKLFSDFKQQRWKTGRAETDALLVSQLGCTYSFSTLSMMFQRCCTTACCHVAYLLHDRAGTLDELPFGEAVSGAELQSSSLLDKVDTAMAQLLYPCLYLEAHLKAQPGICLDCICLLTSITSLDNYNHILNWLVSYFLFQAPSEGERWHYTSNFHKDHGWVALHYEHHYRLSV